MNHRTVLAFILVALAASSAAAGDFTQLATLLRGEGVYLSMTTTSNPAKEMLLEFRSIDANTGAFRALLKQHPAADGIAVTGGFVALRRMGMRMYPMTFKVRPAAAPIGFSTTYNMTLITTGTAEVGGFGSYTVLPAAQPVAVSFRASRIYIP